jgi:hypothetical protein
MITKIVYEKMRKNPTLRVSMVRLYLLVELTLGIDE